MKGHKSGWHATGWGDHCKKCGGLVLWQKSQAGKWYLLNARFTHPGAVDPSTGKRMVWASGGDFHKCSN